MVGRIVGGRYRLAKPLGRGGSATVWRGVDLRTERPVAVKVLDPQLAAEPKALVRLRREAQAVASLDHPNIVAGHDFGVDGDAAYLAMELVDGHSLGTLLATHGQLPVDQAVHIAEQACAALDAAHAARIIHRDIKPGNLIIGSDGTVKICDFGIARLQARDDSTGLTAHSAAVGTCEFMAPEQAMGEPVDARTDLYSLGCVLYAMLAGRPPFLGDNPLVVLHQHLTDPPEPVCSARHDVPPVLDELVHRLLAKDPAGRPATAASVRAELAAIREAAHAPARTPASTDTVVLPSLAGAGRHRNRATAALWWDGWPIVGGCGALVLALALAAAALLGGVDGDRPAAALPRPPATSAAPSSQPTATTPTAAASAPATPPVPAPRPSPPRPPTPMDRLAAFAAVLQRQIDNGNVDRVAGRNLMRQLVRAAQRVQNGEHEQAVRRLRDLDERLDELRRAGKLSPATFGTLDVLDPIIASLS